MQICLFEMGRMCEGIWWIKWLNGRNWNLSKCKVILMFLKKFQLFCWNFTIWNENATILENVYRIS